MALIVSAGLPTGMEGMMYPIPFSEPDARAPRGAARRGAGLPLGVGQRPHDHAASGATTKRRSRDSRRSQMHKRLLSLRTSTLKQQAGLSMEDINIVGSFDAALEKAMRIREAGATHFLGLYFAAEDVRELLDQMQMFAETIMPALVA